MINRYKLKIGSRAQVMHGIAKMTAGSLTKIKLKYNKQGKIVSRKASNTAKKANKLVKEGYITRKGHFGVVKKGGAATDLDLYVIEHTDNILRTVINNGSFINYGYPSEFTLKIKPYTFNENLINDIIQINNSANDTRYNRDRDYVIDKAIRLIYEILRSENYRNFMYNIEKTNINLINKINERDIYNILFCIEPMENDNVLVKPVNTDQKINILINNFKPLPVGNYDCYWTFFLVFSHFCYDNNIELLSKIVDLFNKYFKSNGKPIIDIIDTNNIMYLKEISIFSKYDPSGTLSEFIKNIIIQKIRLGDVSIWNYDIVRTTEIPQNISLVSTERVRDDSSSGDSDNDDVNEL